ncbi:MAG: YVTN family beta-propeller repeat-containing protein [Rikenellaceae bacterium]
MRRFNAILLLLLSPLFALAQESTPLFTTDVAVCDGGELLLTQKGRTALEVYSADGATLVKSVEMPQTPTGVTVAGDVAYVTTFKDYGSVEVVSLSQGAITSSVKVGSGACSPRLSEDGAYLYVCNQFSNSVSKVELSSGRVVAEADVLREPRECIVSHDGKYMFVTNFLPQQRADLDVVAACVSVIDMAKFTKIKDIQLANGSNAVRGLALTPDGKFLYVSHNLGRFAVPTSQLQQGWMNTSAFSIINTSNLNYEGCVIVDDPERGAAGIWDILCTEDNIYISHSGTHEISIIDHKKMLAKFEAYPNKAVLDYDLNFLYGLRKRKALEGNGPRNMALAEGRLIIPTYFADILNFVDTSSSELTTININPNRVESQINKGEKYFNDASYCFQNWQSCNGCHPGDGRADGMNWDLMNDGVGNAKNCKSMLFSHVTPPSMISGIRISAELAVRKGFTHIQFFKIDDDSYAECVDEYLRVLEPVPSPYLVDGELSDLARKGRKVFEKLKCTECHSGPYFTNMKMYVIGDDVEFEKGWDTPTLREVWRTAPYLFDGRAATMQEVFSVHKHGIDGKISTKDVEALSEYVLSL